MPGFGPGFGLGGGISTLIWMIAIIVVGVIVWRGRTKFVGGTPIVLKHFRINEAPSAKTVIEISGRLSGIVSWVLNLLKLEPEVEFIVTDSEIMIRAASLSGIQNTFIPLGGITATVCGYQRSMLAFGFALLFSVGCVLNLISGFLENNRNEVGSDMGLAFGFLILAGVSALVFFLSKRIGIAVETESWHPIAFKRSLIENVSVDLPQALQAIAVINTRILAARTSQTLPEESDGASAPRTILTAASASAPGRCPKCAAVNPSGTRFCENCGTALVG
jgi:hypothetical protein